MKTKTITLDEILNTPVAHIPSKAKRGERRYVVDRIVCADGHTLSVQASETHYCTPRDNRGPWTHVEVGYPTAQPEATWVRYRDGDGDRTEVMKDALAAFDKAADARFSEHKEGE